MEFLVLGPLEVRHSGRPIALGGPQQRAVLAMLLLRVNEAVSRDLLIEGIWGSRPPSSAGHIIESYVSRLRRALARDGGTAELVRQAHGYALRVDPARLDVRRFEALVFEGRRRREAGDAAGAARSLASALGLFRGPPLDDLALFPFARNEVRPLEELRLTVQEERIDALLASGSNGDLIAELSVLANDHPYIEGFHGQLMRALYGAGRQAEALAVYRELRRRLAEELGIEPSPSLRRLELAMLRQEPLEPASAQAAPPAVPPAPIQAGVPPRRRWRTLRWISVVAVSVAGVVLLALALLPGEDDATRGPVGRDDSIAFIDLDDAEIRGNVPLRAAPGDVLSGAGAIWVSQFEARSVVRLDVATLRTAETISVGSGASGMTFGYGSLWVANSLDGTVSRIDARTDRVVDTVRVGEGPVALAGGSGAIWVANAQADDVARLDAVTGEVTRRIPLPGRPTGIAYGGGALWVTSGPAGRVFRIGPVSGDLSEIRVGSGPTDVEAGAGAVWVANTLDGTVSRISMDTRTVTATLSVGDGPRDVEPAGRSVWVANELDGTVARIDPDGARLLQSIEVGGRPQSINAHAGGVWVSIRGASAGQRGGTLRVGATMPSLDSIDPAIANLLPPTQLLGITNDGLVTLAHAGGSAGYQLVPDLALTLPEPTHGGRRYRFEVRPGVRYSTGRPLEPADFRRAIERAFRLRSPGSQHYLGIVGGARCLRRPPACDMSKGIIVNEAAQTVIFKLIEPDPDFLHKLTLPFAAAVPEGVPWHDVGRRPVPATGPYMIESYLPGRSLRLVRNPYFRAWSRAAQPDGYVDAIELRLGLAGDRIVSAIERGSLDWGIYDVPFAPPSDRLHEILTRHPALVHANALPEVSYLIMNTREPPFDDVRVRRALNFAIDRNVLVERNGGPELARPTCQTLPPGIPGYRRYCPYTVNPDPTGAYSGPDVAKAARLVDKSGTRGMRVRVLTDPGAPDTAHVVAVLRRLGYRASAWPVAGERYNRLASNSRNRVQISVGGTITDYPAASNIIATWLSCGSYRPQSDLNGNRAAFCDPTVEAMVKRARRLEASRPEAAERLWSRIDRAIVDRAPWLPTVNLRTIDFVSERVDNYLFHPQWGMLLDQLRIRR